MIPFMIYHNVRGLLLGFQPAVFAVPKEVAWFLEDIV